MTRKRICFILMLVIMIAIFFLSAQTAEASGAVSDTLAESLNIEGSLNEYDMTVHLIVGLDIRKWAHMAIFAALGFSVYGWLSSTPKAIVLSYLYAVSDEVHQLFVEGRSGQFDDTLIDLVGIILGVICFILLEKLFEKLKKKQSH